MLHILSLAVLPTLLIVAATSDVMTYRIPNWLTLLTALLFFPMAMATAMPAAALTWHILAGVLLFVIGFGLFAFNLVGGGDVKLLGALGLWLGLGSLGNFFQALAYAGLVQALLMSAWAYIIFSMEIRSDADSQIGLWSKLRTIKPNIPFGFAIALGGIVAFRDTWWLHGLQ